MCTLTKPAKKKTNKVGSEGMAQQTTHTAERCMEDLKRAVVSYTFSVTDDYKIQEG